MKAMIFAAGKGTRLQPLTNSTPKALVEVNGITLLERAIVHLKNFGIKDIIINIHYLGEQIVDFVKQNNNFDINISFSDETDELLDTGGGLKKASWFFNDNNPFLVYNTDIISDININKLYKLHIESKSTVTLAVRQRSSSRYFLFNDLMKLCGWKNTKTNEEIIPVKINSLNELAFSGIHVISPNLFKFFPNKNKFSIIETYLSNISKVDIVGFNHSQDYWFDVGSIQKLNEAESFLHSLC